MGIPDHLTCLLRNLYAGQEATVRTGLGTTDWFQIGQRVHQGYILLSCLFNLYAELFSSVTQSCPALWDPMYYSTPGLPVHDQLLEPTQTPVHCIGDAIQPSHPLSSPSPPAFNLCWHQGLFLMSQFFTSGSQSIGPSASASVLPMNIQDSFPLGWTGWISLQSKGLSRVFSNTTVQKHQFFGAQLSL